MRNSYLIILIVIILSLQSCSSNTVTNNNTGIQIIQLESITAIDSFQIESPLAIMVDAKVNNLLFYDLFSNAIHVRSNNGKISTFNRSGKGSEEYNSLRPNSIMFLKDNDSLKVVISKNNSLLKYDTKGNFEEEIEVPKIETRFEIPNFSLRDSILYYLQMPKGNPYDIAYYKNVDILRRVNVANNTYNTFGEFLPSGNELLGDNFHRNHPYNYFTDYTDEYLYIVNSNDRRRYKYNLKNLELIEGIHLDLKNYKIEEIYFNKDYESRLLLYTNSRIKYHKYENGKSYTFYNEPEEVSVVKNKIKRQQNIKQNHYVNIEGFDKEIFIDSELGFPAFISNGLLYLKKTLDESSEKSKAQTKYLIYDLNKIINIS